MDRRHHRPDVGARFGERPGRKLESIGHHAQHRRATAVEHD
jgi:hypothetical protein